MSRAQTQSGRIRSIKQGREQAVDVVLVDTAGRLQNKSTLMDELGKVKRVMEKQGPISETLLVLDATTGQNGMRQAQVFAEVVDVTGVVLTKLDGSAKGGIVVSVQRELGVPVKLVSGEGVRRRRSAGRFCQRDRRLAQSVRYKPVTFAISTGTTKQCFKTYLID